jgi:hypothetical protein
MSKERVELNFKPVVDLAASRQEREDTSVRLRTQAKQEMMRRKRIPVDHTKTTQEQLFNITMSTGEMDLLMQHKRVYGEIEAACDTLKSMMGLLDVYESSGMKDSSKNPYPVILVAATALNKLIDDHAGPNSVHSEWVVQALVDAVIIDTLALCISKQCLVDDDNMYELAMQVTEVLLVITSMSVVAVERQVTVDFIDLLITWTNCPLVTMRCQALDCLSNIIAAGPGCRDKVMDRGFLPMIDGLMKLPDQESSDKLWDATSYAVAMIFHAVPLPSFDVVRLCMPALVRFTAIDSLPAVVNAGVGAMAFICKNEDKNYTALMASFIDEESLQRLVRMIVPNDLRSSTDCSNRAFSLNTILGLIRDVPESCEQLYKNGLLNKLDQTLRGYDQASVVRALMILEFASACDVAAVIKNYEATIYETASKHMQPTVSCTKVVKIALATVFTTSMTCPLIKNAYDFNLWLATKCNVFSHLVDGLKLGRYNGSLSKRCMEAIDKALILGEQHTDINTGSNPLKMAAEQTAIVSALKDIETESEDNFTSKMASTILQRHFDIDGEKEDENQQKFETFKFSMADVGSTDLTKESMFSAIAALVKAQQVFQPPVATASAPVPPPQQQEADVVITDE